MGRQRRAGIVVAVLAAAVLAPSARADVYCVHKAGTTCADTGVVAHDSGAGLQAGLNDALGHPGADTVLVGPGTFVGPNTSPSFSYFTTDPTNPVAIVGDPGGHTILQAPVGSTSVIALLGPSTLTLTQVLVDLTNQSASVGLLLDSSNPATIPTGPTVSRVQVMAGGTSTAARVREGASVTESYLSGGTNGTAVLADGGAATLTNVGITGRAGVVVNGSGDLTGRRLTATRTSTTAIRATGGGNAVIDGLSVYDHTSAALGSDSDGRLVVRQATLVGPGSGLALDLESTTAGATSTLTLVNSIVRGYAGGLCLSSGGGSSTLTLGHDDIPATGFGCASPGTFNAGVGNVDVDPRFVDPTAFTPDFRLRYDSPLIDAGDPATCQTPCQSSDLDGLTRPVDGNGDGSAVRDIGAFEYQRRAPAVVATAGTATAAAGQAVTFDGTGTTDPDVGDTLVSYVWSFDDGTTANGPTVTHAFAAGGTHTATLTVTDSAGVAGTGAASVSVASPPAPAVTTPPPLTVPTPLGAGAPDRTKPTLTKLALSRAALDRRHRSTSIGFTLSETAKLVVAFAKESHGISVGHSCLSPGKRHPHGRACTRYGAARSLTVAHQPKGAGHITFAGKVGAVKLAAGTYRLTLVATDAAGNRSTAHHLTLRIS